VNRDRLLVIDDDDGFRGYVRRVSEASGFETQITDDPDTFKEKVRSWQPSVIVLDLNMPRADGIELLRGLVAAKSKAKILIVSGVDARVLDASMRLAQEHGLAIAGTMQKPVRAAALRGTLERLREIEAPLLASALGHAIETGELVLDYQPKLDCRSKRIYAVEALARWHHPTRGIVPPDQFVPLAEQSGLIDDLTAWVASTAIKQAAAWRRAGLGVELALNISALNLHNIDLPDTALSYCREHGVPPEAITLELTESAAMRNLAQTMDVLTRLRLKGFHLSIDDFGTGYSSLVQLQRLPFSELKVDKSFVMNMLKAKDCRVIVEAVVGIGQKLGLFTVAEGVETAECLAALVEMGTDAAQGYFIGRPAGPDRIGPMAAADVWHGA
jgi:EAL domain-containing protein (putative c-di-GMP-specific phosphodiesterase class I)